MQNQGATQRNLNARLLLEAKMDPHEHSLERATLNQVWHFLSTMAEGQGEQGQAPKVRIRDKQPISMA